MSKYCENRECEWGPTGIGLTAAVLGYWDCDECGSRHNINIQERAEILNDFEQKLHVLEVGDE